VPPAVLPQDFAFSINDSFAEESNKTCCASRPVGSTDDGKSTLTGE
jgi:hypothetical protein